MIHTRESPLSIFGAAKQAPERAAFLINGKEITYESLAQHVARAIGWLHQQGVQPLDEHRVAIVGERDLAVVSVLYASIEMGVPIVLIHPKWTQREREQAIGDTRASLVIDQVTARAACSHQPVASLESAIEIDAEQCMAILFTSGTSGRPKGVMLSRRAFLNAAAASAANLRWHATDRWLLNLPLSHIGGLSILIRSLIARSCVVFGPTHSFEVEPTLNAVEKDRVSLVSWVPTMLDRVLREQPAWPPPRTLRAILLGGSSAHSSLLKEANRRKFPVLTTYGMTEACSQITCQRYESILREQEGVGFPLSNIEIKLTKDQEICVRGPTLMSGYVSSSSETQPLSKDDWFATGDIGKLDNQGQLHILGRRDHRIITGGENVDPHEVEQALITLPGIAAACVFGVKDETWGEAVTAAVVLQHPWPTTADLRSALKSCLAPYKIPKQIRILERLPLTATGKPDRNEIVALCAAARER